MAAPIGSRNGASTRNSRIFGRTLHRILVQDEDTSSDSHEKLGRLRRICLKLVELAEQGDLQAIKEIRDTVDGKPVQAIEGGGDAGELIIRFASKDEGVL